MVRLLDVFDYSFNGTFTITCGLYEITTATADVHVFIFSEENPDLDGDGIPDEFDRCPATVLHSIRIHQRHRR